MGMDFEYRMVGRKLHEEVIKFMTSVPKEKELIIYDKRLNPDFMKSFKEKWKKGDKEFDINKYFFVEKLNVPYPLRSHLRSTKDWSFHVKGMKELKVPGFKVDSWISKGFYGLLVNRIDGNGIFDLSGCHQITWEKLEKLKKWYGRLQSLGYRGMIKEKKDLFGYEDDEIYNQIPFGSSEFKDELKIFKRDLKEAEELLKKADESDLVLILEIY